MFARFAAASVLAAFFLTPAQALELKSCSHVLEYGHGSYYVNCTTKLGEVLSEMKEKFPNSIITFGSYQGINYKIVSTDGYYILVNELPK